MYIYRVPHFINVFSRTLVMATFCGKCGMYTPFLCPFAIYTNCHPFRVQVTLEESPFHFHLEELL